MKGFGGKSVVSRTLVWGLAERDGSVPWGDYGAILYHGREEQDGRTIVRYGRYVPPITMPHGLLVCSRDVKERLELIAGPQFRRVERLLLKRPEDDWRKWPVLRRPPGGEPESLVHGAKKTIDNPDLWVAAPVNRIVPMGTGNEWRILEAEESGTAGYSGMWRCSDSWLVVVDDDVRSCLERCDVDAVLEFREHVLVGV